MIRLNIPHQAPIKFAQEVLAMTSMTAKIRAAFPFEPTLGMLIEAAAQSSAAFSSTVKRIGVIVALKEVKLLQAPYVLDMIVNIKIEASVGELTEISFEVLNQEEHESFATGKIILKISE
jgi:hypothetical protein